MSSLFPDRIETELLALEPLHESVDPLNFYRICSSDPGIEEVTEHLPWEPHSTPKETIDFLEDVESQYTSSRGVQYVVRPRGGESEGEIAGATGLTVDWERRTGTLGLWLRKRFWGRGYSSERASALIELAFDRLDLELVAVTHADGNGRSKRAIEKYVEAHDGEYDGILRNWDTTGDSPRDMHRYTIPRKKTDRPGTSGG
jgi:[ribosomal protein S5]-alanine N-acetyltransferase